MHVTVNVWRAGKCSVILWAKGHNPKEIHRDMCGAYGEDCMDRSSVSKWCAFFKAAIPWKMCTTWMSWLSQYSLPHTCPVNFTQLCHLVHINCTRSTLHCSSHADNSNMHNISVACSMFLLRELHMRKKHCVCSENIKLYLGEISTSQPQYQHRKNFLCVIIRRTLVSANFRISKSWSVFLH